MIHTIGYTVQGKSNMWNSENSNLVHKNRMPRQLQQSNIKLVATTTGKPTFVRERIVYMHRMTQQSTNFQLPATNARSSVHGSNSIGSILPAAVSDDKYVAVTMATTAAATLIVPIHGDFSATSLSPAVFIRAIATRRMTGGLVKSRSKIVELMGGKSITRTGHKVTNDSSNEHETTTCMNTMSIEDVLSVVTTTTVKKFKSVNTAVTTAIPVVSSSTVKHVAGTITSHKTFWKKNTEKIKNTTEIIKNNTESTDATEVTTLQQTIDAADVLSTNKDLVTVILRRTTGQYFGSSLISSTTLFHLRPAASSTSNSRLANGPTVHKNWLGKVTAFFTNRSIRDKIPSVTTDGTAGLHVNTPSLKLSDRYESEEYKMNWKSFVPIPSCGGFVGTWKGRHNDHNTNSLISGADKHG